MKRFLLIVFCFFLVLPVYAAKKDEATSIPPRLYKQLKKAEQLIAKKSYSQAEKSLKNMLADVKKKSFGHATVLRSLSSVYALKGQYKKAAETLSQCLNLKVLPRKQEQSAILNLGQLYMAVEQYRKAINVLEPWLAQNSSPNAEINVLIANAYAQLKRYRKALPYVKKAISISRKPKEPWYQLNLALLYEIKDYNSAANLLKKMIRYFPAKVSYWHQLSSVYQQLKQYKKAVSVKHLAYKKGIIVKEKDILDLASLFLYIKSPYKAAKLLKRELDAKRVRSNSKNWESLAQAWTMAREFDNAIKALEMASRLNAKGRLYQQLGQIYIEKEQWGKAISALNKAISKGGLKNAGSAYLLLGVSYFENGSNKRARQAFRNASKYGRSRKEANQWLDYIKVPQQEGKIL